MKKVLLLSLAGLMMVPLAAADATAQPSPYRHGHFERVRVPHYRPHYRPYYVPVYRPRRAPVIVVTPAPPPPPVLIVEEPRPRRVTVVRRSEPARVAKRAERPARDQERTLTGLGLRVTGAALAGEKIGLSTAENPAMGGLGLQLRTRFGDKQSLGLEIGVDLLGGEGTNFDQRTIPVMASLTYHLFPRSRFQPYGLAGVGVHFTRLSYLDDMYHYDMVELAGQLGAGVEIFLTKNIAINADIRAQTIFKNVDTQAKIHTDCLTRIGNMTGFCDNIHSADPDDKVNIGLQLQAGVSWYF